MADPGIDRRKSRRLGHRQYARIALFLKWSRGMLAEQLDWKNPDWMKHLILTGERNAS